MESTFKEDQGQLLRAIQAGEIAQSLKLIDGKEIIAYQGKIVAEAEPRVRPALSRIDVETLASLAELVLVKTEEELIIKVNSPHQVMVMDVKEAEFHQNLVMATAQFHKAEMLIAYVSLEHALTEIRECFEQTEMVESLADTLRTTKIEDITELTDNGMGMNVSVRSRVTSGSRSSDSTVFNLGLTPIRTFYEVVAVPGVFTMRWKRDGDKINVRLIEQQPHKWRYLQMASIATFLKESLPETTIVM